MKIKRIPVDPGLAFCEVCHVFGEDTLLQLEILGPNHPHGKLLICDECCEQMHRAADTALVGEL